MTDSDLMHDLDEVARHCEGAAQGMQHTINRLKQVNCPADTIAKSETNRDEWKRYALAVREAMRRLIDQHKVDLGFPKGEA